MWYIIPFAPNFGQYTTIKNVQSDDGSDELYLAMQSPAAYPAPVTVAPRSADVAISTWQFVYPGYIVSALNQDLVLSLELDGSQSSPTLPVFSNSLVACLRQPGYQPFQLWKATPEGLIVNHLTGQVLTGGSSATTAAADTGNPLTANQIWDFSPGMALTTLLVQPPVPYPNPGDPFNSIYTTISNALGVPDGLRSQYYNLAAPIGSYQSRLHFLRVPKGTDLQDWEEVVAQLNKEMTAVAAVQALFQQVDNFHLALTQAQTLSLSEAITAAALPDGPATKLSAPKKGKGWIASIVEGLTYFAMNLGAELIPGGEEVKTGLKVLKKALPAAANLMETGISAGMTGMSSRSAHNQASRNIARLQHALDGIYNYEISVLELQQTLLSIFNAAGTALGQIEMTILADWSKLQSVYRMTLSNRDLSSLYWPSTMATTLANQMLPGYTIGVLQALMSANQNFKINATMHTSYGEDLATGLQPDGLTFIEANPDKTFNIYQSTANQQVMDMVWTNGVDPLSFYRGLNGWQLPYVYQNLYGTSTDQSKLAASIIITIENCTNMDLSVNNTLYSLFGPNFNNLKPHSASNNLPAYAAITLAGSALYSSLSGSFTPVMGTISGEDNQGRQVFSIELSNSGDIYHANSITYFMDNLTSAQPYKVSCSNYYTNVAPMALFTIRIQADKA